MPQYTVNVDGTPVTISTDEDFTPEEQQEAARMKLASMSPMMGLTPRGASLMPTEGEPVPSQPTMEKSDPGGTWKDRAKTAAYVAPSILANAVVPGGGIAAGLLRAALNAVGGAATSLAVEEGTPSERAGKAIIPAAIGATASGVADTAIGGMNKVQGAQQQRDDVARLVNMFRRLNGQDVRPPTVAGMSEYLEPKTLPTGLSQLSGSELGSTMTQLGHLYGDPTVTLGGRNMPFSRGVAMIQDLGRRVDFARQHQAGEASAQADLLYEQAKGEMRQSLEAMIPRIGTGLLEAYEAANAKHAMNMGVRQVMTRPSAEAGGARPLDSSGRYNAQAAQANLRDAIETGMITRDSSVAEILREGIRRNAPGWSSTDQPAQGLLSVLRAYGNPSSAGLSASVPGLAAMRFPVRIGDAVKVSPATAGVLQPGLPAGAVSLYQYLQSIGGIDQDAMLKERQ